MKTENPSQAPNRLTSATVEFGAFIIATLLLFWHTTESLINFSLHHESSSHIILIPAISLYLLYTERERVFETTRTAMLPGLILVAAAIALRIGLRYIQADQEPADALPGETLTIVLLWLGGFLLFYGKNAWRKGSFALLFLLLMIPLPPAVLDRTIYVLQQGSTEIAFLLFKLFGVPVLREGFVLQVPHQSIEVAKECSGIRSSVALFITCLLAAHLFLRTKWKMVLFVLLAFPLAIIKNGIRITTLTLLSIHVDPRFLTGRFHHDGGFIFFFLALGILAPVLIFLQRSEGTGASNVTTLPLAVEDGLASGR